MGAFQLIVLVVACAAFSAANKCYTDVEFDISGTIDNGKWKGDGKVLSHGIDKWENKVEPPQWDVKIDTTADKSKVKLTAKAHRKDPKPIDGYVVEKGLGAYKYHNTKSTWENARKTCISEGAHLAVLNSQEEHDHLVKIFKDTKKNKGVNNDYFFVGFHDFYELKVFTTIFDERLEDSGFAKWSPGEPNNYKGNERCGSVNKKGGLNDKNCDSTISFFCEQEIIC